MAKGECNCGAVKYTIHTPLHDVFQCHCSICRRASGSGGIAVAIVRNEDLVWECGQEHVRTWTKPGHDWHTSFCQVCGSPLPGINDEQHMYVPVGTLIEGAEDLELAHHLWTSAKASWEVLSEKAYEHKEHFSHD